MKLYFAALYRKDSEGRLIDGQYRGIQGWKHGIKGPLTETEAKRISVSLGAEVVSIDFETEGGEDFIEDLFHSHGLETPRDRVVPRPKSAEEKPKTAQDLKEERSEKIRLENQEFPGYRKAMSRMTSAGFDWTSEVEGRTKEEVKEAWDIFTTVYLDEMAGK